MPLARPAPYFAPTHLITGGEADIPPKRNGPKRQFKSHKLTSNGL